MQDRLDHHRMNDDAALGKALRALPAGAPARDTWPDLAARIRHRHVVRRTAWFSLPAAFTVGIALTLAWPYIHPRGPAPAPVRIAAQPAVADAGTAPKLDALQASSRQWQAWLQKLERNGAPLDGRQLSQAVALQDQIGLVDLQLSATRNPANAGDLWRQRIALLQELGLLHLQPYSVAARTQPTRTPGTTM